MADVPHGTTITFGTSSFTAQITSIQSDGESRPVVDITHYGITGNRRKMPGNLTDPGTISMTVLYDPNTQPPIAGAVETITITFPVPSGGSTGATLAGTGFVSEWSWDATGGDESPMTADVTIVWDGATGPTWTDSA